MTDSLRHGFLKGEGVGDKLDLLVWSLHNPTPGVIQTFGETCLVSMSASAPHPTGFMPVASACQLHVLVPRSSIWQTPTGHVSDDRAIDAISLSLPQLELGDPAFADHPSSVGAHVCSDGIHLTLLEVRSKTLTVNFDGIEYPAIERLPTRVAEGRTDSSTTAVSQSVSVKKRQPAASEATLCASFLHRCGSSLTEPL